MIMMNEVGEKEFSSVEEVFNFISSKCIRQDSNYGFRGHESHEWALESTLVRFVDSIKASHPEYKYEESETIKNVSMSLYNKFKNNVGVNGDIPIERIEKTDLWQLGQHYGLPSPLLDWTYSPYVAIYFALSNSMGKGDARHCVWVLDLDLIRLLNRFVSDEVRPKFEKNILSKEMLNEQFPFLEIINGELGNNKRISFQQGFFTRHEYFRSIEIWLNRIVPELPHPKTTHHVLQKLVFSCTEVERLSMLNKLDKMNINSRTLFPDIFGSVKGAVDDVYRGFRARRHMGWSFSK